MNNISKKTISLALVLCVLVTVFSFFTVLVNAEVIYGDLNNDKVVNSTDALIVLKASSGKVELDDNQKKQADVNGDGNVNSTDALLVLKFAAGKLEKFPVESEKEWEVGDIVTFGNYEQDNDISNGKEAIEWEVLDIKNSKALLISKYALDAKAHTLANIDITWESSALRIWLNQGFLNAAFSTDEQNCIQLTEVINKNNSYYGTSGGNDTRDKVFLLSLDEMAKYYGVKEEHGGYWFPEKDTTCEPSAYALVNNCNIEDNGHCWWWLRSPGITQGSAATVYSIGNVSSFGSGVRSSVGGVRPALWINL